MTNETGPGFDPSGEARSVIAGAVTDFGVQVLSSVSLLEGICEDRLPDFPREGSLIVSAARADVPGMLQQQAGTVGPDNAVRLTAATLAESYPYDPAACVWVVSEFARVLGYQVSDGIELTGSPPLPPDPTKASPPSWSTPPPKVEPPVMDPVSSHDVTEGRSDVVDGGTNTTVVPPQRSPSRVPWQGFAAVGVVAVIGLYFAVAGAAKLPPFASKIAPTPAPTSSPTPRPTTPSPSPSPSPSVFVPNAADQSLMELIPAKVNNGSNCHAVSPVPAYFDANAEIVCDTPAHVPVSALYYYSFGSTTRLDRDYRAVLRNVSATEGKGVCYSNHEWLFNPVCETTYGPASSTTTEGHMVESENNTTPYITFTVIPDNMLVVAGGSASNGNSVSDNGTSLLNWWKKYPWAWIAGG